jgi:hypothetical protein
VGIESGEISRNLCGLKKSKNFLAGKQDRVLNLSRYLRNTNKICYDSGT